jgi:hypothetical protein
LRVKLLVALCLLLSLLPARGFVADVLAVPGMDLLWDWDRGGAVDTTALPRGMAAFERALAVRPGHPDYVEGLARLHDYASRYVDPGTPSARAALERALVLFREAAAARPTWPRTRGRALLVKAKLGQFDAEFAAWLDEATRYGPYEGEVLQAVIVAGFAGIDTLDATAAGQVRQAAERALLHADRAYAARSAALLRRIERLAETCTRVRARVSLADLDALCA